MEAGLIILFVFLGILSLIWHYRRADSLLDRWARDNGCRILDQEYRYLRKGPFFWTSSEGQAVYYVTVRDSGGRIRHAYVRCGGWLFGLLSDHVDVSWVD